VVKGVESGALRAGDALPSTRRLAEELGVSRFTAEQAYEELWAEGYVEARQGSATRVRMRPPAASGAAPGEAAGRRAGGGSRPAAEGERVTGGARGRTSGEARLETLVDAALEEALGAAAGLRSIHAAPAAGRPGAVDFARFNLDPRLYPVAAFRRSLAAALAEDPARALSYGPPEGDPALRALIARRMAEHGAACSPERIVLVDGALHGLDLVLRLLVPRGGSVLVEAPTFSGAILLARASGLEVVGAETDGEGLLPAAAEEAYERASAAGRRPSLLYVTPSFHNPTGSLAGQGRREEILAFAASRGLPLVEDCFEEEIGGPGARAKPIAAMDGEGRTIYLGTFSKVLFPGVRLGWIAAAPALARRLALMRQATGVSGNSLVQAAVAGFMSSGAYGAHVRRVNRVFSRRLAAAVSAFRRFVPEGAARLFEPAGGYLLWLELPAGRGGAVRAETARARVARAEAEAVEACAAEGLLVAPGASFWPGEPPGAFLRLSIAGRDEAEIEEGMARLGRALGGLESRRRGRA